MHLLDLILDSLVSYLELYRTLGGQKLGWFGQLSEVVIAHLVDKVLNDWPSHLELPSAFGRKMLLDRLISYLELSS